MKLTRPQIDNLRHVQRFGEATPRSRAGYYCRTNGLSEYVWLLEDGRKVSWGEVRTGDELVRIIGERLTEAGRRALREQGDTP